MSHRKLLIIFMKDPVPGRVKTRLAAEIGDKAAAEVYLATVHATRHAVQQLDADIRVWTDRPLTNDTIWSDKQYEIRLQPNGDLGQRLEAAFQEGFDSGYGCIVAIGSDCPDITGSLLEEAFELLGKFDIVIGPAEDGGYYLVGMNRPAPWLFKEMPWSDEELLSTTLTSIRNRKLTYGMLPTLNDIDTIDDLKLSNLNGHISGLDRL